jgi:hypothetical protein
MEIIAVTLLGTADKVFAQYRKKIRCNNCRKKTQVGENFAISASRQFRNPKKTNRIKSMKTKSKFKWKIERDCWNKTEFNDIRYLSMDIGFISVYAHVSMSSDGKYYPVRIVFNSLSEMYGSSKTLEGSIKWAEKTITKEMLRQQRALSKFIKEQA